MTTHQPADVAAQALPPKPIRADRLVSLDVLRGLVIAGMILVNDSGGNRTYWPLEHANWNGWTPTDLVFPSFLFMMGVAITLAMPSRFARGIKIATLLRQILFRAVGLFLIAELLYGFPNYDLHTIRIPGVLQRIALCYLCAAVLYIFTRKQESTSAGTTVKANVPVIATLAVSFLVLYWALLTFVPVPGYGAGRLDPEGNLGAVVDRALFGPHLYGQTKTWDPEGLLSTLPAVSSVLLGILAGEWVRSKRDGRRKAIGMIIAGAVLMLAGQLLHPFFPINKKLWTSSFVLLAGGFTTLSFGICYWIVDLRRLRGWTPAVLVFGTNSILAYVLSEFLSAISDAVTVDGISAHQWMYQHLFAAWLNPWNASLGYAIVFTLLIWAIVVPFYRKKIFLRL